MKYLKQFLIIIIISFLGEILKYLIDIPIPASIYGMILMFLALAFKIMKVSQIKEVSAFLIEIMPVMFVPAGVGLIASWDALKPILLQIIVITVITTVLVMGIAGVVTQSIIREERKK